MTEKTIQPEQIRSAVRQRYGQIARDFDGVSASCCGPSDCCSGAEASLIAVETLYETPDVGALPVDVTGLSLGCGDPITLAALKPGQTVLDLGSGGGIDCFLAAKKVGPGGHVIGVDMTADMIDRARANARKLGAENVEFRLGEIEHMPVADETVDIVISNCVINLSPDKPQVFREAYRALRPGGRLAVSDIVTRTKLPAQIAEDLGEWASCVSGAWVDTDYVGAIEAAGFADVTIEEQAFDGEVVVVSADQRELEIDPEAVRSIIYSARVTGTKPEA